ncbi:hypothetical protein ACIG47_25170, partial [Promicromonospora sp. NPDC052451]
MTRSGEVRGLAGGQPAGSVLPDGGLPDGGLPKGGLPGDVLLDGGLPAGGGGGSGASLLGEIGAGIGVADVRGVREALAGMILPGASDTSVSGLVSREVQGEWVDLLGELEAVKAAVTATQA